MRTCHALEITGKSTASTQLILEHRAKGSAEDRLHRLLMAQFGVLPPSFIELRMNDHLGRLCTKSWPVHHVWETLDMLSDDVNKLDEVIFGKGVHGTDRSLKCLEFWDALSESAQDHHMNTDPAYWNRRAHTVPWFFHSDGGEVFRDVEYVVYSTCSSFTRDVDPRDAKFFTTLIPADSITVETEEDIAAYYEQVRIILETGQWPAQEQVFWTLDKPRLDKAGKPFAQGWAMTFGGWQGDLKEQNRVHLFARNYLCNFMCIKCLAHKSIPEANPFDFRESAGWLQMLMSHESYMFSQNRKSPWSCVRSWTIHRNLDDLLHMFWQGFIKDISAQCIWEFGWLEAGRSRTATI
jgi:hypothetical protein